MAFTAALQGKHCEVITAALAILRKRLADDGDIEGYRKDGPVAVAKFELGELDDPDAREVRVLRQRDVSALVSHLFARLG